MKKILIVCLNYYPEVTSTGLYTTEMAEFLANNGYDVSVITGFPYYPQWKIYDSYIDKPKFYYETIRKVKIFRFKQYVPKNVTGLSRIRHLYSFSHGIFTVLKRLKERYDLIIAIEPTILAYKSIFSFNKKRNAKLWLHIQDFEVDAAIQSGFIKKMPLIEKLGYNWERNIMRKFDVVSTISDGMMNKLISKGAKSEKTYFFPNWVDTELFKPVSFSHFRKEHNLINNFIVMYAGSIAQKQDWDIILYSAKMLKFNSKVKFVIIGNGSKKKYLESKIKKNLLENVILLPVQSESQILDILSSADVHILPQKKTIVNSVMPSKLLRIMSVAKPVICLANSNSEVFKLVNNNNIGYVINEDNYEKLPKIILNIMRKKGDILEKGKRAREYVKKRYSKSIILTKFIKKVDEITR